ncbi:SDR family NAD(P)-dependent oxidoreductase [Solirubrobacter soli]|uniref:SDR family NAD(P)-dependent oxidoreductase n=1 Tax=Solirubrobacter soli TaxID=363832 RepID=UPI000425BFFD|nr:SDR family oxidoreductase [Solirubrobacter soli]
MTRPLTIVTGGSRGIGAAVCRRLASEGHDVVFSYVAAQARAAEVVRDVRAAGVRCEAVRADVADAADVDALFDAAGAVTGLVNNAGITGPVGRLVDVDPAEFARLWAVNLTGVLLCCRRAAQVMAPGGSIVNISSGAATLGGPGEYVHYAASKGAVDTITIGLSKELGPDGIRVNAVAPGAVWTEIHLDPERPARVGAQTPLGRAGEPDEIAGAVAWLLSADASYTTGAILRVAGGR